MKKIILSVAVLTLLATGCSRQVHYVNGETTNVARKAVKTNQTFFVGGIGQTKEVSAAQICGGANKVVAVEAFQSPLNIIFSYLTFGIYTPREQTVHCK